MRQREAREWGFKMLKGAQRVGVFDLRIFQQYRGSSFASRVRAVRELRIFSPAARPNLADCRRRYYVRAGLIATGPILVARGGDGRGRPRDCRGLADSGWVCGIRREMIHRWTQIRTDKDRSIQIRMRGTARAGFGDRPDRGGDGERGIRSLMASAEECGGREEADEGRGFGDVPEGPVEAGERGIVVAGADRTEGVARQDTLKEDWAGCSLRRTATAATKKIASDAGSGMYQTAQSRPWTVGSS